MDKKQINGLHKKIVRLIYSGKLFGAITEIKAQNLINQDVSDSSLKMAEDTYKLMLKYSVQGVLDPNRDKIFRQLQVSLLYSADVLRYLLMKKFYPSTIFSLTPVKCPSTMPDNENTVQWFNYIIQNTSFSPFEDDRQRKNFQKDFLGKYVADYQCAYTQLRDNFRHKKIQNTFGFLFGKQESDLAAGVVRNFYHRILI